MFPVSGLRRQIIITMMSLVRTNKQNQLLPSDTHINHSEINSSVSRFNLTASSEVSHTFDNSLLAIIQSWNHTYHNYFYDWNSKPPIELLWSRCTKIPVVSLCWCLGATRRASDPNTSRASFQLLPAKAFFTPTTSLLLINTHTSRQILGCSWLHCVYR